MNNINTKEYWESRFSNGNWNNAGQKQTFIYALANTAHVKLKRDFDGSILDFGCAMGNAIKVYRKAFPNAKLIGIDVSEAAIKYCQKKWGSMATFYAGDYTTIPKVDIIIASHIMEHITDDKIIVKSILSKCKELYIFVPFEETPLYHEHVNYYDQNYYNDFNVKKKEIFDVKYKKLLSIEEIIKSFLKLNFIIYKNSSKKIIMFHMKGI